MRPLSQYLAAVLLLVALPAAVPAAATKVEILQAQSRAAFLAGTLDGISVDPQGRLELADRVERLASIGEPFLLAAAPLPDGWVVGTGNAGRVLKIDRQGEVTQLFEAPEPEVFAVWAEADGTVFAGTSPRGKVYRITAPGQGEVFFEPGETYIWDLARGADGALLVATGTQGKLFRVGADGQGKVLYDSDDTHLRSLQVGAGGEVLVGTAGEGLILELTATGDGAVRARTLHDASQPEVVAFAVAPDGVRYAALVASEASLVDLSGGGSDDKKKEDDDSSEEDGEARVTVTVSPLTTGSRPAGSQGPRGEVVSISADGMVESLVKLDEETVFDLIWQRGRLWVATGLEGKLYSVSDGELVLEKDVDERQVVALMSGEAGPAFATTNSSALYRPTGGTERRGTYTSATLDAGQAARFGSFRWRGETPAKGRVRLSFRSGMSAEPDRTWSPWSEPRADREVLLDALPPGRYVQWRAELVADGEASPVIYGIELSYLPRNLPPKIERLSVLDPGQVLVPANFNPASQIYEPAHPNREGIFTTLEPSSRNGDARLKPLWKKGFRSLRWTVDDPNGDALVYRLDFLREGRGDWLAMVEELEDDHYSFDATVLPDGLYRFRLQASDRPDNLPADARVAERVSEPVVIDHAPPELAGVKRRGGELEVAVRDAWSPLKEAVVSVDAGEWRPVTAADGLLDGQQETLRIAVPQGARLVLLRLTDAAFNIVTFDLSGELP